MLPTSSLLGHWQYYCLSKGLTPKAGKGGSCFMYSGQKLLFTGGKKCYFLCNLGHLHFPRATLKQLLSYSGNCFPLWKQGSVQWVQHWLSNGWHPGMNWAIRHEAVCINGPLTHTSVHHEAPGCRPVNLNYQEGAWKGLLILGQEPQCHTALIMSREAWALAFDLPYCYIAGAGEGAGKGTVVQAEFWNISGLVSRYFESVFC